MKQLSVLVVLLLSVIPAHAETTKENQPNFIQQIVQVLIGTTLKTQRFVGTHQQTIQTPKQIQKITKHKHHRKHYGVSANSSLKKNVYAGGTKYLAHTASKNKLFEEFEEWRWFQLTHTGSSR